MKVYLAGKISDPVRASWREKLLLPEANYHLQGRIADGLNLRPQDIAWPPEAEIMIGGHSYVGPYLIEALDQDGASYRERDRSSMGQEHGTVGPGFHGQLFQGEPSVLLPICMNAVRQCDVLVAFLDADDLDGTLIEIGWAMALDKVVRIVTLVEVGDLVGWSDLIVSPPDWSHPGIWEEEPGPDQWLNILQDAERLLVKKRLTTMPYDEYLKTEHWQKVRTAAVSRALHRCQVCGKAGPLDVHHNNYERRGCELDSDVIALCRDCHALFHGKLPAPPKQPVTAFDAIGSATAAIVSGKPYPLPPVPTGKANIPVVRR